MEADNLQTARPTLRAWVDEYAAIERECFEELAKSGIDFAPADRYDAETREAKRRLRDKGATFRNGDASISTGALSSACVACTGDLRSKTFVLSLQCNRDCYFCFNVNQGDGERCPLNEAWRSDVDEFDAACGGLTHAGLTGGEPLLHREEAVEFVRHVRDKRPDAHVRIYTAGDFLDEATLEELRDAGLDELRMSIKLDVLDVDRADGIIDDAIETLARANRFIPQVMVEMPVIPGTGEPMRRLLERLDGIGAFGINLLEFGYPIGDWSEFRKRGFQVRNPPFSVVYDYTYPAGLPIDGSELLCLELLEFAIDRGLALGVHYCSLENKNRGQVFGQNAVCRLDPELYELDGDDFFYKTAKVFDGDVAPVRERFDAEGVPYEVDEQDGSLSFHPSHLPAIEDLPVLPALSCNVVEQKEEWYAIRELKLEPLEGDALMEEGSMWQARAAAWELLALSFAYPGEELAGAVVSGEWAEAGRELAEELGLALPEGWGDDLAGDDVAGSGAADAEGALHALRVEATRLLVGAPEPAVSPYEGVWRACDDGVQPLLFVNPHSMAVERFMRACGLGRPEGTNEPLDRVDTECELLEHLALRAAGADFAESLPDPSELPEGSPEASYGAFLDEHARTWMPRFAVDAAAEARLPFYRAAAQLLGALIDSEAPSDR